VNTLLAFDFPLPSPHDTSRRSPDHDHAGGDSKVNRLVPGKEPARAKALGVETWLARQPRETTPAAANSLNERVRRLLRDGRVAEARLLRNEAGVAPSLRRALEPPVARLGEGSTGLPRTDLVGAIRMAVSFPGEWVAVQGAAVVDHDRSPAALRERLATKSLSRGVVVVRSPIDDQ
jgi:hypothetical protein